MSESWDEYAEGWDSNADVVLYSGKAYDTLCKIINPEGLDILDFGCGTGILTEMLSPAANRILGLDSSEKMISILKSKNLNNVDTLAAELTEQTIKSNVSLHSKFDLIIASSVCAFLSNYEITLGLLRSLLKPNGVFVQWDWLKTDGDSNFGLTEDLIKSAFINVGLETLSISPAFSLESKEGSMQVIMGVARNA
jgi:predicted TPR repeat methyltransferase